MQLQGRVGLTCLWQLDRVDGPRVRVFRNARKAQVLGAVGQLGLRREVVCDKQRMSAQDG